MCTNKENRNKIFQSADNYSLDQAYTKTADSSPTEVENQILINELHQVLLENISLNQGTVSKSTNDTLR